LLFPTKKLGVGGGKWLINYSWGGGHPFIPPGGPGAEIVWEKLTNFKRGGGAGGTKLGGGVVSGIVVKKPVTRGRYNKKFLNFVVPQLSWRGGAGSPFFRAGGEGGTRGGGPHRGGVGFIFGRRGGGGGGGPQKIIFKGGFLCGFFGWCFEGGGVGGEKHLGAGTKHKTPREGFF